MIDIESLAKKFVTYLDGKPICIHSDMIGIFRFGKTNKERLENFRKLLLTIEDLGGTIFIPTYSMSYTDKKTYNIRTSPSVVGEISNFLLEKDFTKRSADPIFSYLIYSKNDYSNYKKISNYECFGENSLISKMYKEDIFLATLGCGLRMLTEIYLIEKYRDAEYRYDKNFRGETKSLDNIILNTEATYYCRNIDKYPNLFSSFIRLEKDLENEKISKKFNIENKILLSLISFSNLEEFINQKTKIDKNYLTILN